MFRLAIFVLLAAITSPALAASDFRPLSAAPSEPSAGRCHQGECGWTQWVSVRTSVRPEQDPVVNATARSGLANMEANGAIEWSGELTSFSARCSYVTPTLSFSNKEIGDQVHALNLSPQGTVFGYMEDSARLYFQLCHSEKSIDVDALIVKYGYDVIAEE